jgi:alkylation response protein AidB-like acyl-CoA dehydrogenase
VSDIDEGALARARVAAERLAPLALEIENGRRLPQAAVQALVDAEVFLLAVPRAFGGREVSLATLLAVYEEIARADGSAGWCAMIGGTSALMAAYADERLAREVYGRADVITCGVLAPLGRAVRVREGLRVNGRWPFASGCEHSQWRMGGVVMVDGDQAERPPEVCSILFHASETTIVDTWNVSGLRGTGSHDLVVTDLVVPEERCFRMSGVSPRQPGELYQLPFFGVLATGVAAVLLGIGRAAVDAFVALAPAKQPSAAKRTIAHRELVQLDVARAEGKLRAARALLFQAAAEAAHEAREKAAPSLSLRASLRLAACHAASEAAAAVDLVYHAAGASSIYASNPLQRHFRDVHVATQHAMVGTSVATLVGRVLLGVDSDVSQL